MSESTAERGIVAGAIADMLPTVNEGFNTDLLTERYDENPERTAMSVHFTDESGDDELEKVALGVNDDLELEMLERIPESYRYIGAVVTYQAYGLDILDPDHPMTPDRARYQHEGVKILPAEGESRERTWLVISNVLDIILASAIHKQETDAEAGARAAREGRTREAGE